MASVLRASRPGIRSRGRRHENNLLILRLPINGDNHAHDPAVLVHDDRSAVPRRREEGFALVHGIKQIFTALQIALL